MTKPRYRFHGSTPPVAGARTPVLKLRAETEVPDLVDGVATMRIYDPIDSWGGDWGVSAKEFANALDRLPSDTTEIRLFINSPGGEIDQAITMVNDLRRFDADVVACVNGLAASAASFLAVSADKTLMSKQTQLMIHDGWGMCVGPAADMHQTGEILDRLSNDIASIYAEKAGGDVATWRAAMLDESWYTPDEALTVSLIDAIEGEKAASAKAFDTRTLFAHASRSEAPAPIIPAAADSADDDSDVSERDSAARASAVRREHAHRARARKLRASAS